MRGRIVVVLAAVAAIALLVSCGLIRSKVPVPGTRTGGRKVLGDVAGASVELLGTKMSERDPNGWVHISGTARYIPARVAPKPFSELGCPGIHIEFLDGLGRKVFERGLGTACGEYDQPDNVVADVPFPFHTSLPVEASVWAKIASHRVAGFGW